MDEPSTGDVGRRRVPTLESQRGGEGRLPRQDTGPDQNPYPLESTRRDYKTEWGSTRGHDQTPQDPDYCITDVMTTTRSGTERLEGFWDQKIPDPETGRSESRGEVPPDS